MAQKLTEIHHSAAHGLELREDTDVLTLLADGQSEAAQAVGSAISAMAKASALAAASLRSGGRLIYAAAGSSGLMALADALELPGTYGIPRHRIVVLLAGGMDALVDMTGSPEDDGSAAETALGSHDPNPSDCLIAVTASGQTPYPVAAARMARKMGTRTIGIANNADAALFGTVDVPILLPTPPEVIAGSTRMGAGTAQKIALNMLSTLMAIRLGHVHDGMMVNLLADNAKLRERAKGIVMSIAGVDAEKASAALDLTGGAVKPAVLIAAGAAADRAALLLDRHEGHLRPALAELGH
ncbi:N-acetylmuramic acid 6-phosphate etherase [Devosia chinhatensis]|uniref:Acetylmuramic acid-6-phosphate etherase n=1 Tax=Devosia chinhatensis TaxID=429727 RepID=A0A0F5FK89_9HYPH|nr:N-acetylmuramic acid 6-phosphate etherase [Devosia chinhatensis]KKB09208.1 acetylmuramic acid-6-phosphate etherase [Devosia chinhatensis]